MVERNQRPNGTKAFSPLPLPDLAKYTVIAQAEGEGKGFWAGGCSCLKNEKGEIWLVYRLRNPSQRGHALCIATSHDGIYFQTIKVLHKEKFGHIESLERASFLQDPWTGKYKLYPSVEKAGKWYIYKLEDVTNPEKFDASTAKVALSPSNKSKNTRKVKDPYVINLCNTWHMFYSGSGNEPQEETFLAISQDGKKWVSGERPVFRRKYWHDYHTRMSCFIPTEKGFVALYEGSSFSWYEPHFNLNVGLGYTADMRNFFDLTPQAPVLFSATEGNFSTIRYLDYVFVNDKILFYYEAARDDDAFELRVSECKAQGL